MVAPIHTPNIRRIYSRPRQRGTAADAGKVATCVQVAVRPQTTVGTLEPMLRAFAQLSTTRAGLAGIGRVDVFDRDTHLDPLADVRQVFHRDFGDTGLDGGLNDGLARFVVDVLDTPHLLAGDLPELLFRALAAVGLETAAQGKVTVALVAQMLAAEDLAQAVGGELVFSNIHAHHGAGCHGLHVAGLDDEVKKPLPLTKYQLGLLGRAASKNAALMFAHAHGNRDASVERVERDGFALEGVGAFVEVDAGTVEADFGDRCVLADATERRLRLVGLADRVDGVATHLAAQRRGLAQCVVRPLVQPDAVPQTMLAHDRHQTVAGIGVGTAQADKRPSLLCAHFQPHRHRAHHRSSPFGDVMTVRNNIVDHASQFTPHGAPSAPAIPPLTQVRGFLAEIL